MISRLIAADVDRALARQAAAALIGPRQLGKTTLALAIGEDQDAFYLDLEDRDYRSPISEQIEAIGVRRLTEALSEAS